MSLKHTYSLISSNPKLTGNVKLVITDNSLYLESIDANKELSLNKYKAKKVDENSTYSNDVFKFFNGLNPKTIFDLKDNEDFSAIKQEYNNQYYTDYQYSCYPKISKEYKEQIGYFAPLCLEDTIPEYFCIYKVPNIVSIKTNSNANDLQNIEKQIYGGDNYLYNTILKDATIHKVFSLKENTKIGKYLRNHKDDIKSIESPLHISFEDDSNCYINGISLEKGGIVSKKINLYQDLVIDKTILEFDNTITNLFSTNNILSHNVLNLEFLFDDESSDEYSLNRYFGFYTNKIPYSKFKLDDKKFYSKRNSSPQNSFMVQSDTFNIDARTNINVSNDNGVILYTDDNVLKSIDIYQGEYLPYIQSVTNKHYTVNTNTIFDIDSIQLKETNINLNDFVGFDNIGFINANKYNDYRKSQVVLTINSNLVDCEIRLKSVNENDTQFDKNFIFISDSSLPKGNVIGTKFSSDGTISDNVIALSKAINNLSKTNDEFGITAIPFKNKIIIQSRINNSFANRYEYLIYSKNKLYISTLFESDIFIPIDEYNSLYRNLSTNFKEYSLIDTVSYTNIGYIHQGNFKGGSNTINNSVLVDYKYIDFFNESMYVKTNKWYSKISNILYFINDSDISDIDKYFIVECDDILVNNSGSIQLYSLSNNYCGLFEIYHLKQYDTSTFTSTYGKPTDGYINKLKESILEKVLNDGTEISTEILNDIDGFSINGFTTLSNDVDKIDNEYDRLKENEIAELSLNGRVIPFINKWVIDDIGKDVKENDYRLNTSLAFTFSNFSSSEYHKSQSVNYNTHEWYYLGKYPKYLSDSDKANSYSYFNNDISIDDILQIDYDLFETHFTENKVGDLDIPRRYKYSVFSRGNSNTYSSTTFRGSKIIAKRRKENSTELNYNVNEIVTYKSEYFNDYKFSAVLTNNTNNSLSINVIENKKYKNIVFFIEANLDDYYLTRDIDNEKFIDRCILYIIKHNYKKVGANVIVGDVALNGVFVPFNESNKPTWKLTADGYYNLPFIQNTSNYSLPNLSSQINTNELGKYNEIIFETNKGFIKIDNIVDVGKDFIKAKTLLFSTNGNVYSNISQTYLNIYPTKSQMSGVVGLYKNGGYSAYSNLINDISYSSLYDKVNNAEPSINYVSIDDNDGEIVITNNEYILEFVKNDIFTKASYLNTVDVKTSTLRSNDFKSIGSELIAETETKLVPLSRTKGNYNTKVNDILFFNDNHKFRFNDSYLKLIKNKNVQFYSSYKDFAIYKEMYINKVNPDNSLKVLELNTTTVLQPKYWKIDEIAIDYMDKYIFKSSWDNNYYRKYSSKNTFEYFSGYVEPLIKPSLLGSSIMNIPNNILLNIKSEHINYTEYFTENSKLYKVDGEINIESAIIDYMYNDIEKLYIEYVHEKYNYNDIDTFDDDILSFIRLNILNRYFIEDIQVYSKTIPKSNNFEITNYDGNFTQKLIQNDYSINKRLVVKSLDRFNQHFVTNIEDDTNVSLSFVVKISII